MDTKKLRQKILDLAIRGKLVPQDPNDEPASVLLERIRAEKERLIKEGKIKRSKKSSSDTPHYENEAFKVPFEIPDGWISCRFDRICSKFSTGPFGSMVHKADYVSDGGVPIVNPMNIVAGDILNDNLMMVSNEKAQELNRYRLSVDDILIARRGDLKKCAIVKETTVDWLCGTGSFFLHVPYVESRYIQLFYLSEYVQTILSKECVGATMDNLNQSVLGAIPFLLPPQKEQRRIISEVDKWFSLIDTLKTEKEDLQTYIAQAKSKILYMAIHGKLVPQDPNDELAIELLKRINPRFTPCDNAHERKIPINWCETTVGEYVETVTDFVASGSFASLRENVTYYKEPNYAILVKTQDFQNGFSDNLTYTDQHGYDYLQKSNLFGGELILSNVGSIGKLFIVPKLNKKMTLAPNAIMVRFRDEDHIMWFYYLFSSMYGYNLLLSIASATAISKFNKTDFKKLIIPIPPIAEQTRIVAKIEELFAVLDEIQKSIEA